MLSSSSSRIDVMVMVLAGSMPIEPDGQTQSSGESDPSRLTVRGAWQLEHVSVATSVE